MNITQRKASAITLALSIAVGAEGLRQYAYDDTGGILTTCYGHTGKDVVKGKHYSLDECKSLLNVDMGNAIDAVDHCVPNLPMSVLAAFGDITYNEGPTAACNKSASHAARYLASGQYELACKELPKWNKAKIGGTLVALPGLTTRRNNEVALCLGGLS